MPFSGLVSRPSNPGGDGLPRRECFELVEATLCCGIGGYVLADACRGGPEAGLANQALDGRADYGDTIQAIADAERAKGSPLHERLSVFWGTPSTLRGQRDGGRFPPLDRLDLIESGRLLIGSDEEPAGLPRPSADELLVTGARFALRYLAGTGLQPAAQPGGLGSMRPAGEDAVEEIRSPDVLLARGVRRVTKLVLFPVRFLFTAATGQVGTNAAAAARYREGDQAPSADLVRAALAWRTAPPTDEPAAAELLRGQLVPLYLQYVDDHIRRLGALGEIGLASAFERWRARLAS